MSVQSYSPMHLSSIPAVVHRFTPPVCTIYSTTSLIPAYLMPYLLRFCNLQLLLLPFSSITRCLCSHVLLPLRIAITRYLCKKQPLNPAITTPHTRVSIPRQSHIQALPLSISIKSFSRISLHYAASRLYSVARILR